MTGWYRDGESLDSRRKFHPWFYYSKAGPKKIKGIYVDGASFACAINIFFYLTSMDIVTASCPAACARRVCTPAWSGHQNW